MVSKVKRCAFQHQLGRWQWPSEAFIRVVNLTGIIRVVINIFS